MSDLSIAKPPVVGREGRLLGVGQCAAATMDISVNTYYTYSTINSSYRSYRLLLKPSNLFVVHGHDEGARETVARFLEKLDFQPVILHEQANQGRTVIEKIEANSDVGFAVVLLTPDDEGCVKGGQPKPRARQNVLLELGYFIGHLGREKVCALKRGDREMPSDYLGVVWQSMDTGSWKSALCRELDAAGHEVDWKKAMQA